MGIVECTCPGLIRWGHVPRAAGSDVGLPACLRGCLQIFPPSAALKVTRMLIDRMVNDPAFGIHVKVAEVLNPSDKVRRSETIPHNTTRHTEAGA